MKRLAYAAATLALALAAAAPALSSDFFPPSPVPSTRDNPKTATTVTTRTDKAAKNQTRDFILSKKIVKTTKPTGGETTPNAKTPGAL